MFVSYSHKDAKLAAAFMDALSVVVRNGGELGLSPERLFFDRARLMAGDAWSSSIQSALEKTNLMLFLVSTASLNSNFCLNEELAVAAANGAEIVPVLLTKPTLWEEQPIPRDARGRRLGSLNAVPTTARELQPISGGSWPNREQALAEVMDQLVKKLRRELQAPPPAPALQPVATAAAVGSGAAAPRRALSPLLTNLCNQSDSESSFENGLDAWPGGRALLVLVKGEFADDTTGFWARLRRVNLAGYCDDVLHLPLRAVRPLLLPRAGECGPETGDIVRTLRRKLSEAFTGKPREIGSGERLAALLANDEAVQPLWATLPQDEPEACGALLRGLIALLEETPEGAALQRLALAVLVEDPALVAQDRLLQSLGLHSERVHLVETRRLRALSGADVKDWFRFHELKPLLRLDEQQFVDQLFGGAPQLRHRPFDDKVRPMLGLAPAEGAP